MCSLLVLWAVAITSCCYGDCQQVCHPQAALTLHLSNGDQILLPKQSGTISIVSGYCRGPGLCSAVGQAPPRTGGAYALTAAISSCWRPGCSATRAIRFDGGCQNVRWQLPCSGPKKSVPTFAFFAIGPIDLNMLMQCSK